MQDLAALSRLYAVADKQVVNRAVDIALALPAFDVCDDAKELRAIGDAPPPEQAQQIAATRETQAQARSLAVAGKSREAAALAGGAVEAAEALGYLPLTAEARLGTARKGAGDYEAAIPALAAAVSAALASRDNRRLLTGLCRVELSA